MIALPGEEKSSTEHLGVQHLLTPNPSRPRPRAPGNINHQLLLPLRHMWPLSLLEGQDSNSSSHSKGEDAGGSSRGGASRRWGGAGDDAWGHGGDGCAGVGAGWGRGVTDLLGRGRGSGLWFIATGGCGLAQLLEDPVEASQGGLGKCIYSYV
jgi:hypothetical protein